jgi:hypothetical protein
MEKSPQDCQKAAWCGAMRLNAMTAHTLKV